MYSQSIQIHLSDKNVKRRNAKKWEYLKIWRAKRLHYRKWCSIWLLSIYTEVFQKLTFYSWISSWIMIWKIETTKYERNKLTVSVRNLRRTLLCLVEIMTVYVLLLCLIANLLYVPKNWLLDKSLTSSKILKHNLFTYLGYA